MAVGVHRQAEAERLAQPREVLDLAHAAPVVRVAQDDLRGALAYRRREIGERRHGDIRGERRLLARVEQRLADGSHAVHARAGVLEIAAAPQLAIESAAVLDGSRTR